MAALPGYIGLPVLGDQSLALWRHPVGFVREQKRRLGNALLFQARVLGSKTAFVTSYSEALAVLRMDESQLSAAAAYRPFLSSVYSEDNILLTPHAQKHAALATALRSALQPDAITSMGADLAAIAEHAFAVFLQVPAPPPTPPHRPASSSTLFLRQSSRSWPLPSGARCHRTSGSLPEA